MKLKRLGYILVCSDGPFIPRVAYMRWTHVSLRMLNNNQRHAVKKATEPMVIHEVSVHVIKHSEVENRHDCLQVARYRF